MHKFLKLLPLCLALSILFSCEKKEEPTQHLNPMLQEGDHFASSSIINPDSEVRGVWIASVFNIDYPSAPNLSAESLQAELDAILETCTANGLNTVFFQVRPTCDALYQSDIFPVSANLSSDGTLPFDPLGYLVTKAHSMNIYVHAWVNPLRVTVSGTDPSVLPDGSPAKEHPEWTVPYADGKLYLNPGLPEVRQLVVDGVGEIVAKYDVDGVVFDDYFYPYPANGEDGTIADFDDGEEYALYGAAFDSVADWRRNNINQLVELCYDTVHATDSECVFGVAPFGVWQNDNGTNGGSATRNLEAYHSLYCDALAWAQGGYIDYLSPQLYWTFTTETSPYDVILCWWNAALDGTKTKHGNDVKLYVSHGAYNYENGAWDTGELSEQVAFSRSERAYRGSIFYGYDEINRNINGASDDLVAVYDNEIIYTDIASNGQSVAVASPAQGTTLSTATTYLIGTSDPYYPLTLNGQRISRTKSGYFSVMVELEPGENRFTFLQNGVEYTHTLYYSTTTDSTDQAPPILQTLEIINPYPSQNVATAEKELWVSCTAPYGSYVTARVNGVDYELTAYDLPNVTWSPNGYVGVPFGKLINLPQADAQQISDAGTISFTAWYNGGSVSVNGGNLRLLGEGAYIGVTARENYTQLKLTEASSYYNDYTVQSAGMTDAAVGLQNGFYHLRMGGFVAEDAVVELENYQASLAELRAVTVSTQGDFTEIRLACDNCPPYHGAVEDGRFVVTFFNTNAETAPEAVMNPNPLVDLCETVRLPDANRVRYAFRLFDESKFYGFDLRYENGYIVVSLRNPKQVNLSSPQPLQGISIVLDAGHGGWDNGATGPSAALREKDLNLAIVLEAAEQLRALGADITLTRDADTAVELMDRVTLLEALEPDLCVSVHQNSMDYSVDITRIRGTLALYCMDSGRLLAECLADTVSDALNRKNLGANYQMLAMCRNPKFPAALVEVGFITGTEEYEQISSPAGISEAATGIVNGILEYFKRQGA